MKHLWFFFHELRPHDDADDDNDKDHESDKLKLCSILYMFTLFLTCCFPNKKFLRDEVVNLKPNPTPGGPWD